MASIPAWDEFWGSHYDWVRCHSQPDWNAMYKLCSSGGTIQAVTTTSTNIKNDNKNKMSTKYYRVKKDTFLWSEGAILNMNECASGYTPIEDLWNKTEKQTEYITAKIVEAPENAEYFERVYPDTLKGNIYRTADQLKEVYKKAFIE